MPSAIINSSSTLEPQNDDPDSTTYRQDLHSIADDPFEQHDVVVVGAGPSGLFCALKMAKKGIDVLVIESGPAISESPRAIAYMPIVLNEFEKVGIFDDLVELGHQNNDGIQFRTPHNKGDELLTTVKLNLVPKSLKRYPFIGVNTGQDRLAHLILKHAQRLPNFHIKFSHTFAGVQQDDNGVRITAVTSRGEKYFAAKYLIGADGTGSSVRRSQCIPFRGFTWNDFRFMAVNIEYDFASHGYSTGVMVVDDEDWAVIARIDKEGLWRVAFGVRCSIPEKELLAQLPEKLERLMPGPRPLNYKIVAANPYWAHQRVAEKLTSGRVILTGDAAHSNNPIGGLGLTTGLLDATALGNCMIRILTKNEPDPAALLERYSTVRKKAFVEYTNTASIENKLRLHCQDDEFKAKRAAFIKNITDDPEATINMAKAMNEVMDDDFEE
ncbi:hypothetical protein V501_08654 [Pseudogymnoascus sp. VKM F-4519 (FW-2642)]|nr:hypothetical protein V501_08654 [Pseudogymnoascus sp. VKM F-4519 (FW-2642)]